MLDNIAFVAEYLQKKFLGIFVRQKILMVSFSLSLVLNIFLWLWLYFKLRDSADIIPLHYNIYFGIDLIGQWKKVFILPLFGLGVILVNLILAGVLFLKEKILSYFLAVASVLVQLLLLFAGWIIVWVNT